MQIIVALCCVRCGFLYSEVFMCRYLLIDRALNLDITQEFFFKICHEESNEYVVFAEFRVL